MEAFFELLLEIVGELFLPLVFELLFKGGGVLFKNVAGALRRVHWALAALAFALTGALAGVVSLAMFPHLMLQKAAARAAYVVVSPLLAGAFAYGLAKFRRRHDEAGARHAFASWLAFAVAFALVRAGGVGPWGVLRPH